MQYSWRVARYILCELQQLQLHSESDWKAPDISLQWLMCLVCTAIIGMLATCSLPALVSVLLALNHTCDSSTGCSSDCREDDSICAAVQRQPQMPVFHARRPMYPITCQPIDAAEHTHGFTWINFQLCHMAAFRTPSLTPGVCL